MNILAVFPLVRDCFFLRLPEFNPATISISSIRAKRSQGSHLTAFLLYDDKEAK